MEIKGKIVDVNNQPLYLANITIVTGSQINKFVIVANDNGEFSLSSENIKPNSQFKISYQGFKPQFYKASELQGKKIKLEEDIIGLNEVVVFSHGKPKDIIASDQPSNIKQHFQKHKLVYAGLGGLVGLLLLLTSIKKLK